jgi:hypothetical protein
MLRARFLGMAAGTSSDFGGAGMRLVALHALCMAARSAVSFFLVTALTRCFLRTVVWLMTAGALLMPDPDLMRLAHMTRLTPRQERGRFVRQSAMTAGTVRVTSARGHARKLRSMTAAAQRALALGKRESVRLVALRAGETTVKLVVRVRGLMATAAAARRLSLAAAGWVRVVAARAARLADARVVRVQGRVALGAGLLWTFANGVRSVAARALLVGRDARCPQHQHAGVARATGLSGLLFEFVRPMTTHAFGVSASEERACRHDRALRGVAALASSQRLGRRRVLVLVTGRAHVLR